MKHEKVSLPTKKKSSFAPAKFENKLRKNVSTSFFFKVVAIFICLFTDNSQIIPLIIAS